MAQLKTQLSGVAKHGFWILTTITILGSVGAAFWSASQLAAERDKNIQQIEADNASMKTINNEVSTHPNDKTAEEMEALIKLLEEDVKDSWTKQYERQQDILVWPVDDLGQEFVDAFKDFVPIELETEFPLEQEIEIGLRNLYRDYIGDALPDIAKIAGAEWTADFQATASAGMGGMGMGGMGMGGSGPGMGGMGMGGSGMGMGSGEGEGYPGMGSGGMGSGGMGMGGMGMGGMGMGGMGTEIKEPPLVQWSTASQAALMSNLFPWRPQTPGTLDVLYSQENLWILRQIMEVISAVNGDAKQPFQAVVRDINEIAIGKAASKLGGGASMGGGYPGMGSGGMGMGSSGMGMGSSGMGMGSSEGSGGGMGMMGMGEMDGDSLSRDPADMRYVDVNYEPIDAQTLRSDMESRTPEAAFAKVAKRVPIKLNLQIDQRKIPLLVAECGNAALSIEVRQVRINPTASAAGGMGGGGGMGMGSGGMGMGSGGMGPGDGGMGDSGMGGMGMGGSGMGGPGMGGPGMGGSGMDGSGMGGMGMGGMGMGGSGMGGSGMGGMGMGGGQSEFPNEANVELYGVIYIYNPPAMEELGQEQVDENTLIEGDSETVGGTAVVPENPVEPLDPNAEPGTIAGDEPGAGTAPATDPDAGNPNSGANGDGTAGAGGTGTGTDPPSDSGADGGADPGQGKPTDDPPTNAQQGDETQPPGGSAPEGGEAGSGTASGG